MGVSRLYVRAGTFTHGEPLQLFIPQTWVSSGAPFKIVLVYNFDLGLIRHIKDLPLPAAAAAMARDILSSSRRAQTAGAQLEGVQFDVDCPTRLLSKYADLIAGVKADLGKPEWQYSATTLSSWLGTDGMRKVADQVDYLAPQFYESDVAFSTNQVRPISDLSGLEKGLEKAGDLNKPFYAGLSTYGHALLYDDRGQLAAVYRGLTPENALRHPSFRYDSCTPLDRDGNPATAANYMGEDLLSLTAIKPGNGGKGLGYQLKYYVPTPALVGQELRLFHENAPENCRGVIFYRMPEEMDTMALPLVSVEDALQGRQPAPNLTLNVKAGSDPWRKVESDGRADSEDVRVKIVNEGDAPTCTAPDAVEVVLFWGKGALNEVSPGLFDSAVPGHYDPGGGFQECPQAEANAVRYRVSRLLPGQSCAAGEVQIEGTPRVEAIWTAKGPGGLKGYSGPAK